MVVSPYQARTGAVSGMALLEEYHPIFATANGWGSLSCKCLRRKLGRWPTGAGEGIRTLDPNLGKVMLYP